MNYIPRNVVRDLLPVYLSGEASQETRDLVEYHLERDPDLRDLVESIDDSPALRAAEIDPLAAAELRAIDETSRLLNRKIFYSTASFSLTSVALSLAVERTHVWLATILYAAAIGGWILFLYTCRNLSTTGLESPKSITVNALWSGIGGYAGFAAYHLFLSWAGYRPGDWSWPTLGLLLMFAGWAIAWFIGRRWHLISADECHQPVVYKV